MVTGLLGQLGSACAPQLIVAKATTPKVMTLRRVAVLSNLLM
jgi:hypothetical protein